VLGLAVLLAAATAAADTVIIADEVIFCRVVSADTNFVRLELPEGGIKMLYTRDVSEIRLTDSSRVAELVTQLPQARITLAPARQIGALDTLSRNASPTEMAARCRDMDAVLRECGRSDNTVFDLLREVDREQEALRGIWPRLGLVLCLASGTGLGGGIGAFIGEAIRPTVINCGMGYGPGYVHIGGGPVGCLVGSVVGTLGGAAIGISNRAVLVARHRGRVNDLIRKVNRAIASQP